VVGAVFCFGCLQLRIFSIVVSDEEVKGGRLLYNLDPLPILSRTPPAHLEQLNHARLAVVANFLDGSGLSVQAVGKFEPQFSLIDPLLSRMGRFSRDGPTPDILLSEFETLHSGMARLRLVDSDIFAPPASGLYFPPLDDGLLDKGEILRARGRRKKAGVAEILGEPAGPELDRRSKCAKFEAEAFCTALPQ
jgi:hypothetical protein